MTMTYEEILYETASRDERIVVMTAENRAAIRSLPATLGPRFIDMGITEQTMVGAAAGLALRGRIPVVHALATFLTMRAFEFIRTDIGIANLPVKLIGGVPGILSEANGPTHQAIEDIAIMRGIPGMKIFCPADEQELVQGMPHILKDASPWYVRYNARPSSLKHYDTFSVGTAEVLGDGMDVALISYGAMAEETWRASQILASSGVSVRFINMRTLKPVDESALMHAAKECSLLVTVEDHFLTGGLHSILSEVLLKHRWTADVAPISFGQHWFKPALLRDVLHYEGFTAEQIAAAVLLRRESPEPDPIHHLEPII